MLVYLPFEAPVYRIEMAMWQSWSACCCATGFQCLRLCRRSCRDTHPLAVAGVKIQRLRATCIATIQVGCDECKPAADGITCHATMAGAAIRTDVEQLIATLNASTIPICILHLRNRDRNCKSQCISMTCASGL